MLQKALIVVMGTLLTTSLLADFATDFQAVVKLYNEQKNIEAHDAFMKLAALAPTPKSKAESMSYAASSLSRQKKYDEAIELANKIELKPVSKNCRLDIMFENRKFKEIAGAFKDEDIGAWPDYCVYNGFSKRGNAYRFSGDLLNASSDLEKAVEAAGADERNRITALSDLGDVYKSLKEDQKALDTYLKASAMTKWQGSAAHYNAAIRAADILGRQGKYDVAMVELKKIDISKTGGHWKFQTLKAYGELYEIQGKKEDALKKYKEALSIDNVHPALVNELNNKISSLEGK